MNAEMNNNEHILKAFISKVWNEKDFESIPQFVADEYTVRCDNADPWEGKTLDHIAFKTRLNYSFDSFPDMHFEISSTIADGDAVAAVWIMTGTNTGKIDDYPPTNKSIRTSGITIYHFSNGKICGHTQVYDRITVMKQLGFIR